MLTFPVMKMYLHTSKDKPNANKMAIPITRGKFICPWIDKLHSI